MVVDSTEGGDGLALGWNNDLAWKVIYTCNRIIGVEVLSSDGSPWSMWIGRIKVLSGWNHPMLFPQGTRLRFS